MITPAFTRAPRTIRANDRFNLPVAVTGTDEWCWTAIRISESDTHLDPATRRFLGAYNDFRPIPDRDYFFNHSFSNDLASLTKTFNSSLRSSGRNDVLCSNSNLHRLSSPPRSRLSFFIHPSYFFLP